MIVGFAGNLEKPGIAEIRSKLMAQAERLGCECVAFDSVEAVRLTRLAPELLPLKQKCFRCTQQRC